MLGKVGAEMIITDPVITERFSLPVGVQYAMEALFALGVIVLGRLWVRWKTPTRK